MSEFLQHPDGRIEIKGPMVFQPTMQLRWHECTHSEVSAVSMSWGASTHYELQQLWRSDTAEEWRAVPTE